MQHGRLTQAEKVLLARRDLRERGIARSCAEPPLYRLLWKTGIPATPPLFLPRWKLAFVQGVPFAFFFAAFTAILGRWGWADLIIGVPIVSLFYGLVMSGFARSKALTLDLPRWEDFEPTVERS